MHFFGAFGYPMEGQLLQKMHVNSGTNKPNVKHHNTILPRAKTAWVWTWARTSLIKEPTRILLQDDLKDKRSSNLLITPLHRRDWFKEPTVSMDYKGLDNYSIYVEGTPFYFWSPDGARAIFGSSKELFAGICPRWQSPRRVPSNSVLEFPTFKIETLGLKRPRRAVVPFSGGIDCTIIAIDLLQRGYQVELISVYNEKKRKFKHAYRLGQMITGASWICRKAPKSPFSFIIMACKFAQSYGECLVAVGGTMESDGVAFPGILYGINEAASYHCDGNLQVSMPFMKLTDEQTIDYGIKIGAPLEKTMSCRYHTNCGLCYKCKKRRLLEKRLGTNKYVHAVEVHYPTMEQLSEEFR